MTNGSDKEQREVPTLEYATGANTVHRGQPGELGPLPALFCLVVWVAGTLAAIGSGMMLIGLRSRVLDTGLIFPICAAGGSGVVLIWAGIFVNRRFRNPPARCDSLPLPRAALPHPEKSR